MFFCPICGSLKVIEVYNDKSFKLLRCKVCSVFFKIKKYQIHEYYQNIFSADPNAETSPNEVFSQIVNKIILSQCALQRSANVLDFGCSNERLINLLKKNGFSNVYGVEPFKDVLGVTEKNIFKSISELPKNILFDMILMIEVIEHLENPREILNALISKLKDGGYLFITTPNTNSLKAKLFGYKWKEILRPSHVVLYNRKSLIYLLNSLYRPLEITFIKNIYYTKNILFEKILNFFNLTGCLASDGIGIFLKVC